MELWAAEGSRTEWLGGPGQASGAETSVERRRTCAFDTLKVSGRCGAAPEGAGPGGGAEACPRGSPLRPRAGSGPGSGGGRPRATVPTALTAPPTPARPGPKCGPGRGWPGRRGEGCADAGRDLAPRARALVAAARPALPRLSPSALGGQGCRPARIPSSRGFSALGAAAAHVGLRWHPRDSPSFLEFAEVSPDGFGLPVCSPFFFFPFLFFGW